MKGTNECQKANRTPDKGLEVRVGTTYALSRDQVIDGRLFMSARMREIAEALKGQREEQAVKTAKSTSGLEAGPRSTYSSNTANEGVVYHAFTGMSRDEHIGRAAMEKRWDELRRPYQGAYRGGPRMLEMERPQYHAA